MNSKDVLRTALTTSYEWIKPLADDLADAPMTSPTSGSGNHPLWIMGHVSYSSSALLAMITGKSPPLETCCELFAGGSQPIRDVAVYPHYAEILAAYDQTHQSALVILERFAESRLDERPPAVPKEFQDIPDFSSNGSVFLFIAMHEMSHRGQLADARRTLGRAPFA